MKKSPIDSNGVKESGSACDEIADSAESQVPAQ